MYKTLYFNSAWRNSGSLYGKALDETPVILPVDTNKYTLGATNQQWGIKVFLRKDTDPVNWPFLWGDELTTNLVGSPPVQLLGENDVEGEWTTAHFQWNCPHRMLNVHKHRLVVVIFVRSTIPGTSVWMEYDTYNACAFITELLDYKELSESTWSFYLRVKRDQYGSYTWHYWERCNGITRIENVLLMKRAKIQGVLTEK